MGYTVGIYDKDRTYALGLMNYFNKNMDIHIKASAFTERASLEEYIRDNSLDIMLVGDDMDYSYLPMPIIHICDDREVCKKDMYIYKYQNMRTIADIICNYARGKVKKVYTDSNGYGVFSPLGRCGKTTLAKGLTYNYGNSIYIGVEEYMPVGDGLWQEEFSYYLAEKNLKLIEIINELPVDERGNRYLHLVDSYIDMRCVTREHIAWLVEELKNTSKFNYIVFDIGQASLSNLDILGVFEKVYIPVLEDSFSKGKLENFKSILQREELYKISSRIRFVEVPKTDYRNLQEFIEREEI